jgi:hypothetical protein
MWRDLYFTSLLRMKITSYILKEEWVKESPNLIPELTEEFQVSENFMRKNRIKKLVIR